MTDGSLLTDPASINARFAWFYQELYSSQMVGMDGEPTAYLEEIALPCLRSASQSALDGPITLEELQQEVAPLQNGKTLNPDGITAELFKTYAKGAASYTPAHASKSHRGRDLSPPIHGQSDHCGSLYRPISLLSLDAKLG